MNEQQLYESATANDTSTACAVGGSSSNENIRKHTFSALYLGQPDCDGQSSAKVEICENDDRDDRASSVSIDSVSPLLGGCH